MKTLRECCSKTVAVNTAALSKARREAEPKSPRYRMPLKAEPFGASWIIKDGDGAILAIRPSESDAIELIETLGALELFRGDNNGHH
jgi:hypothetical protein